MRHLRPDDLPHIKEHVGIDMTPREMARWLEIPESEVMYASYQCSAPVRSAPTRLFTPWMSMNERKIAEGVHLATRSDEYEPYSAAEWQAHLAALEALEAIT